ncbi:protein NRT1/ PTR FAMILY 8.5-like [Phragmites australis]|uniref:protein NRT1/ PTR FAMILY 8.5-like n=1 Tax=Phragmites australis TaxID=29695 RepID=UPI002D7A19B2|nr:protein NRT1/ PTR FAMILY 8.5-like [Phragmites australis]
MALVTFVNIAASPLYIKVKPQKSIWVSLVQVIFVAIKNRHIQFPEPGNGLQYHNIRGLVVVPSSKIRFLNRACVMRMDADYSNMEVFISNPWNVCTVEQVEDLKRCYRQTPWTAVSVSPTLRYRLALYQYLKSLLSHCGQDVTKASAVEAIRRKEAIKQGLVYDADGTVSMSALWLAPQCVFSGLTSGLGSIGQIDFYYAVLPKTMGSLALTLHLLATGIANVAATVIVKLVKVVTGKGGRVGWLPDNLNQGHYDYYSFLHALLGIANFIYFVACCYWFEEPTPNQLVESHEDEEDGAEI